MKLISWNVNGLRSVSKKGFLDYLRKEKADIICCQETKIKEDQIVPEQMIPKGYSAFFSSAEKKGYSGLATYLHPNQSHQEAKLTRGIGARRFDSEGRFLITHHKGIILYNVYIPSGTMGEERQDFKYRFLDRLYRHLKSIPSSQQKKIVICGDFNICHREIDIHHPQLAEQRELSGFLPDERKWMDRLVELGFVDTFRLVNGDLEKQFTWWSYRAGARKKNLGWRIDYFFVAQALAKKVKDARIAANVMGSDHCPIMLELSV